MQGPDFILNIYSNTQPQACKICGFEYGSNPYNSHLPQWLVAYNAQIEACKEHLVSAHGFVQCICTDVLPKEEMSRHRASVACIQQQRQNACKAQNLVNITSFYADMETHCHNMEQLLQKEVEWDDWETHALLFQARQDTMRRLCQLGDFREYYTRHIKGEHSGWTPEFWTPAETAKVIHLIMGLPKSMYIRWELLWQWLEASEAERLNLVGLLELSKDDDS